MRSLRTSLALIVAAAQLALASCGSHDSGLSASSNMTVAAPCPAPGEIDPLSGIEGWAPGAGEASKMGSGAQQQMGDSFGALGGSASTPTPTPTENADKSCQELSPAFSATLGKLADLRKQLPTTSYDVSALAATFKTPDDAFAFVRDNIRTEAYAGILRGSRGTLMSRAGSPADKAMLLHDLLAAQSIQTRFVHAPLTDDDAGKIVNAATTPAVIDPKGTVSGPNAKDGLSAGLTIADGQLAKARVLLSGKGLQLATDASKELAGLRDNVRDHWWLQAQLSGTWTDLDPTLANATSGSHVGPAATDQGVDAPPASLHHTIAIRLLSDTGGSSPQVIAHAESSSDDALEQPIVAQMNGDTAFGDIKTQTSFVPMVSIGGTKDEESAITPDGDAKLKVLYLEVQTTAPGGTPVVHRQVVVDRRAPGGATIDPSWTPERTAYALTFAYRGLEQTGDIDPIYNIAMNIDATIHGAIAANYGMQHPDASGLPEDAISEYPYEAHRFFEYDQSTRYALQRRNAALNWTFDRPMIALYEQTFDKRTDTLQLVQAFDIVDNSLLALAHGNVASADNMERGFIDTSVENSLISGPGAHVDTATVFAAAKAAGKALTVRRDIPNANLDERTVAIAPDAPVAVDGINTIGWIEVNLDRGNLVGRTATGAGQAAVERSILEKFVEKYSAIKAFGRCLNCFFSGMSEAMTGSKQHGQHFGKCLANALCQFIVDWAFDEFYVHGFEMEGTGFGLVTGPYLDILGELIHGGPTGAICDNISTTNPYSAPIIG